MIKNVNLVDVLVGRSVKQTQCQTRNGESAAGSLVFKLFRKKKLFRFVSLFPNDEQSDLSVQFLLFSFYCFLFMDEWQIAKLEKLDEISVQLSSCLVMLHCGWSEFCQSRQTTTVNSTSLFILKTADLHLSSYH